MTRRRTSAGRIAVSVPGAMALLTVGSLMSFYWPMGKTLFQFHVRIDEVKPEIELEVPR